jgi:hypothetical protein
MLELTERCVLEPSDTFAGGQIEKAQKATAKLTNDRHWELLVEELQAWLAAAPR